MTLDSDEASRRLSSSTSSRARSRFLEACTTPSLDELHGARAFIAHNAHVPTRKASRSSARLFPPNPANPSLALFFLRKRFSFRPNIHGGCFPRCQEGRMNDN